MNLLSLTLVGYALWIVLIVIALWLKGVIV